MRRPSRCRRAPVPRFRPVRPTDGPRARSPAPWQAPATWWRSRDGGRGHPGRHGRRPVRGTAGQGRALPAASRAWGRRRGQAGGPYALGSAWRQVSAGTAWRSLTFAGRPITRSYGVCACPIASGYTPLQETCGTRPCLLGQLRRLGEIPPVFAFIGRPVAMGKFRMADKKRSKRALASGSVLLVGSLCAAPGIAAETEAAPADKPTTLDAVSVTGSRVMSAGFESPTPVTSISQEQIQAEAPNSIVDYINTLPAMANT